MNVLIIEEEKKIANKIVSILLKTEPQITVVAVLETIKDTIAFFQDKKIVIDLVFTDVTLPDGIFFSIFKAIHIPTPIVFITRFDEYMMNAMEYNGIDYILKPVNEDDIKRALGKYKKLQKHFLNNTAINNFIEYLNANRKTRFIVKWGTDNIALPVNDIALFNTKNKVVFAIDKSGKKYIIDKTMIELENELDNKFFFRVNRQYIVNINYIKGFSIYERVKLEIELTLPDFNDVIIVSQDTATIFKNWISQV
jgi:DNA-binding LytR/AlgR family response regulator